MEFRIILRLFQENNSFFLTDLKELTSLDRVVLDKGLKRLFTREILSRKKEPNPNSFNYPMHFKFRITELEKKIYYDLILIPFQLFFYLQIVVEDYPV